MRRQRIKLNGTWSVQRDYKMKYILCLRWMLEDVREEYKRFEWKQKYKKLKEKRKIRTIKFW